MEQQTGGGNLPTTSKMPDVDECENGRNLNKETQSSQPMELKCRVYMVGKALLTGFGFMCDAYDLFVINLVLAIMQHLYPQTVQDSSLVASCVVIGAVVGQLTFGALGDRLGRKPALITTFCLLVFGSIASAVLSWPFPGIGIYGLLALWRFILGFGIGGEYPLSATASSEQSPAPHHVAFTFSMQGMGNLLAPVTVTILLVIFASGTGPALDAVWRLATALAAIYVLPALIIRLKMHGKFTPKPRKQYMQTLKSNWFHLIGSAGTWLLFDIVFYANGLFSSTLIELMGLDTGETAHEQLMSIAKFSIYLGLMALPGYWAASLVIDRVGLKRLQMIGFVLLIIIYSIMGSLWDKLIAYPGLFIFLYGLSFFMCNFGPNTTTFVMPATIFPSEVRSTCSGLSAAAGKIGAVIGAYSMKPLLEAVGPGYTLIVCAGVAVAGLIVTIIFVPSTMPAFDEVQPEQQDIPLETHHNDLVLIEPEFAVVAVALDRDSSNDEEIACEKDVQMITMTTGMDDDGKQNA